MRDRDMDDADGAILFGCTKQAVNRMRRHFDDVTRLRPGPKLMTAVVRRTQGDITPADFSPPVYLILKGVSA
ncbi:MAG: hypothetical protein ACT6TH_14470 [Brevundimonas sp.]|uniref:hypothetical protein n=1 Tax=Brevundimonas sp. TaxID=1871086 RepID=UPI00403392E8